jgi:MFS family permease
MVGMLDVFFALLAIDVLGMGESGAGILAAGFGFGLLVGAAAAVTLAAARRLAPAVFAALAGSGVALAGLALAGIPITAVVVLAACGASIGVFAVASRTLLQRTVDDDVLARVFGLEEALQMVGLAIGSAAAPILISAFGDAGALAAAGLFLALVALLAWPRLRRIDREAHIAPAEWIWLLRSIPIFAPLPQARLERLASHAIPLQVPSGTVLIREGDEGDRFYAILEGTADVTSGGRVVATHTSGGYVGEIALLRDVPRTATVTARTDLSLLALERADFLAAVTGSRVGRMRAHQEADRRIADLGDGSSEG